MKENNYVCASRVCCGLVDMCLVSCGWDAPCIPVCICISYLSTKIMSR